MKEEQLDSLLQAIIKEAAQDDLFLHYLFTSGMFAGISGTLFDQFFTEYIHLMHLSAPELAPGYEKVRDFHLKEQRLDNLLLGEPAFHAHTSAMARLFSRSLLKEAFALGNAELPDSVYNLFVLMGLKILTECAIASSHILPEFQGTQELAGRGTGYRVIYLGNFVDSVLDRSRSKEVAWNVKTMIHPFAEKHELSEEGRQAILDIFRLSLCKAALLCVGLSLGLPGLIHGVLCQLPHFEPSHVKEEAHHAALKKVEGQPLPSALAKLLHLHPEALACGDHPFFPKISTAQGEVGFTTRFYDYFHMEKMLEKAIEADLPDLSEEQRHAAAFESIKQIEAQAMDLTTEEAVRNQLITQLRQHLPSDPKIPRDTIKKVVDGLDLSPKSCCSGALMSFCPESPPSLNELKREISALVERPLTRQFDEATCQRYKENFLKILLGNENHSLLKHLTHYYVALNKILKKPSLINASLTTTLRPYLDYYILARTLTEPLSMWQQVFKLSDAESEEEKQSLQLPPLSI